MQARSRGQHQNYCALVLHIRVRLLKAGVLSQKAEFKMRSPVVFIGAQFHRKNKRGLE